MWSCLLCPGLFVYSSLLWAATEEEPSVVVTQPAPNVYQVSASFVVPSPLPTVWECLTSYDRLAQNIPSVEESRLLEHTLDGSKRLFQRLRLHVLSLIPVRVHLELRVRESPYSRIEFEETRRAYFTSYQGRWEVVPLGSTRTLIRYTVEFSPRPLLRPLIHRSPTHFVEKLLSEMRAAFQRPC
ncbi:MAG: SRPBCC family protein [Candidatus Kapabacteria bacterium]|nr:SRPBCC family protein [Candidatus Kapabacteria bacterium]MDW8224887.1 SRPBCC family protein [Bacteroidota bacterium]